MKILLYDMGSYTQRDLIYCLEKRGCLCRNILYKPLDLYHDAYFEKMFTKLLTEDRYDFVLSTNFFPLLSKICYQHHIKYLSWTYDSPIDVSHVEYFQYPTNYLFFFDQADVRRVQSLGGIHVFHLPLAVNTERLDNCILSATDPQKYSCDISFVGQFYKNSLDQLMSVQSEYDKGYVDAIIETQLHIYGYNFVDEMISDELLHRINQKLCSLNVTENLTRQGLMQSIFQKITRIERLVLLQMLDTIGSVRYYSNEQPMELTHLEYGGTVHYFTEMPKVFKGSKLNLCPTLKSIESGIPLRALDILGCKGNLFCNYQPELAEYFTDGIDVIMYDSIEDAVCKADYYLQHDEERLSISQKGYEKVKQHFSYDDRIYSMLKTAGIFT